MGTRLVTITDVFDSGVWYRNMLGETILVDLQKDIDGDAVTYLDMLTLKQIALMNSNERTDKIKFYIHRDDYKEADPTDLVHILQALEREVK